MISKYRIEISGNIFLYWYKWDAVGVLNVANGSQLTIFGKLVEPNIMNHIVTKNMKQKKWGGENQSFKDITINGGKVYAHSYRRSYGTG